jgi:hypothetical protein
MNNIISSNYPNKDDLENISNYIFKNSKRENIFSNHEWCENVKNIKVYDSINSIRHSNYIHDAIQNNFKNYKIKNVKEVDEIYYAVSPKYAKSSDKLLVDCHYDAPLPLKFFKDRPIFYRIIVACNENTSVITSFPNANIKVKMNTGDFHGLDYNTDYHCVEGEIPINKYRVLLKLHYILIPNNYPENSLYESFIKNINIYWTIISREVMRMSSKPKNIFETIIGYFTILCMKTANNISYVVLIILIILIILYFIKKKFKKIKNTK